MFKHLLLPTDGSPRSARAVASGVALAKLAGAPDDKEAFAYLDKWLELAPFDRRVHQVLLMRLAVRGRLREAQHCHGQSRDHAHPPRPV